MAVRSTMAALIARVRLLINDTSGSPIFQDQDIQDTLDACRVDVVNMRMIWKPTSSGGNWQYLNYYTEIGDWEDDVTFMQNLLTAVTPSVLEPIAGHWKFATSTYPEVYITGKTYDRFRAAADLLEQWSAKFMLQHDFSSDGQSFRASQQLDMIQKLALSYRKQQRPVMSSMIRTDVRAQDAKGNPLGPRNIDYFATG